jgi:Flp pilus assembly protein TadG
VGALVLLLFGGIQLPNAVGTYRKVTDTTVELANVAAQYTSMSSVDVTSVMLASSQVMSPYPTDSLAIVLSEITTNPGNQARVTWSQAHNGARPLRVGSPITLPSGLSSPSTSYILVTVTYLYTPLVGGHFIRPIPMTNQIYVLPRASPSIPYTG